MSQAQMRFVFVAPLPADAFMSRGHVGLNAAHQPNPRSCRMVTMTLAFHESWSLRTTEQRVAKCFSEAVQSCVRSQDN